jgi:hypothetical protein
MNHEALVCPLWDDALPVSIDAVVRTWSRTIGAAKPWSDMPLDDIAGALRSVAIALVNAAYDDEDARRRRIATAAYEHGLFRRAQRFPRKLVATELVVLREAIRADLTGDWPDTLVDQAIDGLVRDVRLARTRAERALDRGADYAALRP